MRIAYRLGGEIGRRARLKIWYGQPCESSSLSPGTKDRSGGCAADKAIPQQRPELNIPHMASILPINVADLLNGRTESARLEFKASWNTRTTGPQVVKTICAFANDFQSLGGGYVVIGVAEPDSNGKKRITGLSEQDIDAAQRWLRGHCAGDIKPGYTPVCSSEVIEGRSVLVVRAAASQDGPHQAVEARGDGKREMRFWIRVGPETVDAQANGHLPALLEKAALPWDNQVAQAAEMDDLREATVREYLHDVRSGLREQPDAATVYRHMDITAPVNNHETPRNVGLLFFSDDPRRWFAGARIVVAQFAGDSAGQVQAEHVFRGPLPAQLRDCLRHLEGLAHSHVQKQRERSQVRGWVSYPVPVLREAIVNAVYHRSYRPETMEPTKICLYPDRVEVISYPGPVPGIERHHLRPNASIPPVGARNPRVGEFLKSLGLAEGWRTGVPNMYRAMAENGSPEPRFDFDAGWFRATLPAHPEYAAVSALQDAAYLRTVGSEEDAFRRVREAWRANENSAALATELIRQSAGRDDMDAAERVFERFRNAAPDTAIANVSNTWVEILLDHERADDARRILEDLSHSTSARDAVDAAILARRLRDPRLAHRYFEQAGDAVQLDARALHEFAQTKMRLAQDAMRERRRSWRAVNQRLLVEARQLLERVLQMNASATRRAWAWRDLARVLNWLSLPAKEVEVAFGNAIDLLPTEARFEKELQQFRDKRDKTGERRGRRGDMIR